MKRHSMPTFICPSKFTRRIGSCFVNLCTGFDHAFSISSVAVIYYFRSQRQAKQSEELTLSNPISLKSAITFALVFATILMLTRLAITYLGDTWLPEVVLVSGLTDADVIAFSVSDAQQVGLISSLVYYDFSGIAG